MENCKLFHLGSLKENCNKKCNKCPFFLFGEKKEIFLRKLPMMKIKIKNGIRSYADERNADADKFE